MNIREQIEEREALLLSPYAAKSRDAIRDLEEAPDPLRTAFQRDRDRIIHSKCFRRLKHKTQVYIAPGDHYRTRMTHTLEVGQIGRTVARALRLNEDLVEAIAMGHDVGHTPFGHVGEYALRDMVGHFNHNEQSLRMVDKTFGIFQPSWQVPGSEQPSVTIVISTIPVFKQMQPVRLNNI